MSDDLIRRSVDAMNDPRQEALEKAGQQMAEAIKKFNKAIAEATAQYRKTFESIAKAWPGQMANLDKQKQGLHPAEILTRDEAFRGLSGRRKKGKTGKWES